MSTGKKFMLELPLKVILTEDGTSNFISHKKKLLRIKMVDNTEEYGIALNKFSPQSIQNMILIDYISKVEISMSEFVSKRQEIMDLSKLIVYSVMYKQFDREIFQSIIETDCIRKYNRTHAGHLIDEKTQISDKQLRAELSSKNAVIDQIRKTILTPIWKNVMSNKEYSPEEKNIFLLMSEKFMNRLSLLNWHIFVLFYKDENFGEILSQTRKILSRYMDKSRVADYISTMVMELALNSENANITKEAQKMYPGREDLNMLVLDPDVRKKIVRELEMKKQFVFLSWKLGGGSSSIGKQGRLQITLYNKSDEFSDIKETVNAATNANTNKKSLVDFYRDLPAGEEGTDLGMYYLSYLEDACKKVNVKFDSLVNQFASSDLTVITLTFSF
ncbi:MAG: hypothetical protein K2N58_06280 [Treponemataceae bacterium]|nr:hypothetical protein [Treponemataceae bacterium]